MGKSLTHQLEYGGSYQDYVKAMSCFNDLVAKAIPIETHTEKKIGTSKANPDLKQVYVLVSAYKDGNSVVPVEFEVKTFWTNNAGLYLSVVLTKIDSEVLETPAARNTSGDAANLFSESGHSLASIFANVNPQDGRFLKYLPDGFLNEDQKTAKAKALQKQADEYANYRATEDNTQSLSQEDSAYLSAMKSGDMETAQRMVDEAAKQFGTELETAENAVKAMQQVLSEAARAEKNTTQESDVRKYVLKSYSEKRLQNWKDSKRIVVYKDKQQFERLLQDAISGKNSTWKMYFGSIPKALADRILSDTGIDVENYNVSLTAYESIKILKGHGNEEKEALRGQRAIIIDDYLAIPLIIEQPTNIKRSSTDYMGKPVIEFVRSSGDTRYKLAAVVSNKHLDFFVQTMYA